MSITSLIYRTKRLETHVLDTGGTGRPVLFIHGNVSGSEFFRETLDALPPTVRGLAPDLRGFGRTEALPIDATQGVRDFSRDLHALVEQMELVESQGSGHQMVLVGWSLGGGVALQYAIDYPEEVAAVVLLAPMSPFGFGGTRDLDGTPNYEDHGGSGAGTANPMFVAALKAGDRSADAPTTPRNILRQFYFKAPFRVSPELEDRYVDEMLRMQVGDDFYPGDGATSANWPGQTAGLRGVNNAVSPKYTNLAAFADITPKPPVLWIHGDSDSIVSDSSLFCFGYLGQLGILPGWPGDGVFPPQPMVSQMRSVLDKYAKNGGKVREVLLADCGHSPHIEKPAEFQSELLHFIETL